MSANVKPVPGAARYTASIDADEGAPVVVMESVGDDGKLNGESCVIQICASEGAAKKAADRWQKRENTAVKKAAKAAAKKAVEAFDDFNYVGSRFH